jgi:hypothetical protein
MTADIPSWGVSWDADYLIPRRKVGCQIFLVQVCFVRIEFTQLKNVNKIF